MGECNIDYLPAINYALVNYRVDICQSIELTNTSEEDLKDVVIECGGEFFLTSRSGVIDIIKAGKSVHLQELDLQPMPAKIASITEKTLATFNVKVLANAANGENTREVADKDYQIEVMPYDQWLGTIILPQCLASFVIPNHPAINRVVVKAAQILKEISHSSAFTEYQSGNSNEVRKQVAAIYGALHAESIVYRSLPASYEVVGQRITLPHQVLASKLGNCIELTLLFASVLESVGINSGVILQKGNAYLAVWLVDDCCQYSVCDDPAYIEKKCSNGIDEMLVIECTQITAENTSFEDAQRIAENNLADLSRLDSFIDIRRCRLEQFRPLPLVAQDNGAWVIDTKGVEHEECVLNVREHSRYDLTKVMESKRELTKMDLWERKLLDFSLRNSMLNLYLRQKAIQFVSFDVHLIEDYLQDGNEYVITSKPNVDLDIQGDERLVRSKQFPKLHDLITNDIKHRVLHTYQTDLETHHTLKNIYRAARNAIEETGANALYLAIGTLRWFETDMSDNPRYAPLLMLPVEMVYKKGDYYIRTRDEDIALNITLIEFLRQNYGITISGLDTLPKDDHGVDVPLIFAIVREALKNKKRWDVEEESILGVFSFNKFLMWNDIHNHRRELLDNDIVRSLVEQKLTFTPTAVVSDLKESDKSLRPEDLALPVSADSSQMAAVIEAGQGHSFLLYGPPGTGKSQTITNLIANALYQGKRVLFVAEKMAALSVVQTRLAKIGLAPFCLEMHSNKITKRHVLEQLKTALGVTHIVRPEAHARIAEQLYDQRKNLIAYMEALHDDKGPEGMSLYDCIVRYETLQADALDIDTNGSALREKFHVKDLDNYSHLLHERLNAVVGLVGQPSRHPLRGLRVAESDLADMSQLTSALDDARSLVLSGIDNRERLSQARALRDEIARDCNEGIFGEDAESLHTEWRTAKAQWFLPRYFAKKKFVAKMRQFNSLIIESEIDTLIDKLADYQKFHAQIQQINDSVGHFSDTKTAVDALPAKDVLEHLATKFTEWPRQLDKVRDWYHWCAYRQELNAMGLDVIAKKLESEEVAVECLRDSFFKTMFKDLANRKIAQSPVLRTFEGSIFDETVARYRKLTEEFQVLSQKELYAKLAARIPHVADNIDNSSEIGLLNRNISNGGRGLSLRDLMDQIPTLLPRLCPCMLMSPMSVAQFLNLSQDKFDLVVFDEASQMPTSEAVGAIARGRSVIVVGDPKQMPPTSFFNSTSVSEDEAELDDMESILEDCRTLEIPSLQLNWHYRSQHESLIAFSNNEYYDGNLITFPSVDDQTTRVRYQYVDGVYDKGGRRSNRKEAEAVVREIARRLAAPDHADFSIGVIAFSVVQQNLIEDLLMEALDKDKRLREAAEEIYEPIFVKNLENVQGDERDIVLFSVGYGPDKDGKVSMNFGPLNNVGGERRLNVAVSRARREMIVFSALKASQIDLRRSKAKGVEGLKHFLEYAEQQILVQPNNAHSETSDSIISRQIAEALRKRGYTADTNIGRSNFKVDVAISDSESADTYSLGLLLDGEGYHQTQTTRDREIVQPSVLRMLNWNVMRVWTVDWMTNPERVLARIERCLKEKPIQPEPSAKTAFDISDETVEELRSDVAEYDAFVGDGDTDAMSDKDLATEILKAEQPMTLTYLCRRICSFRDSPRLTPTVLAKLTDIVSRSMFVQEIGSAKVVWTDKDSADNFRGYRKNNGRDITEMPIVEIMNAIAEAVNEQFSIKTDALTLIVAKKLGFTRRGAKVDQALNEALDLLVSSGKIVRADDMLRMADA